MRAAAIVSGLVMFCAAAAVALSIFSQGKEGDPGFVGPGVLIADVNLAIEIVLVLGLTVGAWLARRGSIEAHRVNQTVWVLVNAALVAFIMFSSMQDAKLESLASLAETRLWVTWLHALIGTLTLIAGLWLVLQMNDVLPKAVHVSWWKTLMRCTLAGYWTVALLGLWIYYLWYGGQAS
jgi:hypothetical protein